MKVKSFAKINLNLHIHPKKTGESFTPLTLLNNQINIFDSIEFINQPNKIELFCSPQKLLPQVEENLVFQAAVKLKEFSQNPNLGVKIFLQKNIPFPAGLAGGSSDAASTLKSLIKMWGLKIKPQKILSIASDLGKDVPYFLSTKLCQLTGYGDIPHPLKFNLPKFYLVIIYPNHVQKPSTGWMFQHLDFSFVGKNYFKFKLILSAIKSKNQKNILANLHNDFEDIAFKHFPEVKNISQDLIFNGSSKTLLAGSGLGVIGFFENKISAQKAFLTLKDKYFQIFFTNTI